MASSVGSLPPASPSPVTTSANGPEVDSVAAESRSNALDGVPNLVTRLAVSEDDKVEALRLIADSVAQQRQLASSAMLFHPLTVSALVLMFGLAYQYLYTGYHGDWALIGTTSAGILMSVMITVRWATGGYLEEAERVGTWKWLDQGRQDPDSAAVGSQDDILLTRFGDEPIGALILRGVRDGTPAAGTGTGSARKTRKGAPTTGLIRGWSVKRRYRRKGIGQGLLEEAVALCRTHGWNGPEFAPDHANSAKLIPRTFQGGFAKRERQARDVLERVKEDAGTASQSSAKKVKR